MVDVLFGRLYSDDEIIVEGIIHELSGQVEKQLPIGEESINNLLSIRQNLFNMEVGDTVLKHLPGEHDQQSHTPKKYGISDYVVSSTSAMVVDHKYNIRRGFITDDGRLLDTKGLQHSDFAVDVLHVNDSSLSDDDKAWFRDIGLGSSLDDSPADLAVMQGFTRVHIMDDEIDLLTRSMDTATLHKLQNYYMSGLINRQIDSYVVWAGYLFARPSDVDVSGVLSSMWSRYTWREFLTMEYVRYDPNDNAMVLKQLPIGEESINNLLSIRQNLFNMEVGDLAGDMYGGKITLGQWEEDMKRLIREFHSSYTAVRKGGWDNMTHADWGKLGNPLKAQYKYLHNFAKTIADKRDTISLEAIQARAKMYGNAAGYTANVVMVGDAITKHLPWLPRDGSTECITNCKCRWELLVVDTVGEWKVVQAVWRLSPAEHCDDCLGRNGYTLVFNVHKTVDVPRVIGYTP